MLKMKKVFILLVFSLFVLLLVGCKKPSLSLDETSINLTVGDTYAIRPVLVDIEGDVVTYEVNDKTLLFIEGNIITALKAGTTSVDVFLTKYPEQKVVLEVVIKDIPELILSGEQVLYTTQEVQLNAKLVELTGEITWETSNDKIATVDNKGLVKAIKAGTVTITAKCGEYESSLEITVKNMPVLSIEGKGKVAVGKEIQLEGKGQYLEEDITWETSDATVATVEAGKVVGVKTGTVTITAKSGLATASKEIEVYVPGTDAPTITFTSEYAQKAFINWGEEFDYLKGIIVTDVEEGDITNSLEVTKKADSKEYGIQVVEYKVSDSDGNTATFEREVEVIWNYDVQFIGHQGSYYGVPNTEEAILNGITKLKYQCIEIDIKQTKDGVFVLCHDDTFGGKQIASTNWADLKDVVATSTRKAGIPFTNGDAVEGATGSYSSKICTLARYLEICKEYNVTAVIELKSSKGISNSDQSRMQALMDEIENADMLENVILLGSAYNCLIWTRNNGYEYIPCQYLVSSIESETSLQRCIDYNLDISTNTTYGGSNSDEWIARYKEAGIKISTYTYTQYVDYPDVQKWIDKGVDFLTCDWQLMDKLNLPVSSNEPVEKFNVKFVDSDGTVLKERTVEKGKTAAAPAITPKEGYEFTGWDKDLKNIQADTVFTAQYEPTKYSITYMSNLGTVTESSWATKEDFKKEFYGDLFEWFKSKGTELTGLTIDGETYKFSRNGVTVTFKNAEDIMALDIYDFEKTISNIMYKPVERNSDGTCVIYEDEDYFLNSPQYRIKYQGVDQWLYNCIKSNYAAYDTTYKVLSSGKIQIFFRMHQWFKGTNITGFNKYPAKYIVEEDQTVKPVLPTAPVTYTILDTFTLPVATGNVKFLGWYLTADYSGEAITSIPVGTTGNLILYAKWEK